MSGIATINRVIAQPKILSGQASTGTISIGTSLDSICIMAPTTVDAGTYVLQVSPDGSFWSNLHDGSADVTCPAAGKSRIYLGFKFPYLRINGPTAAADRTFYICAS